MKKPISQDLDRLLTIYSNMSSEERQNGRFITLLQRFILNAAESEEPEEGNDFAWLETMQIKGGQE